MLNKSIKIFINYLAGPILFLWLLYDTIQKIKHEGSLLQQGSFYFKHMDALHLALIFVLLLLMLCNWSLEAMKWRSLFSEQLQIGFIAAFKSVLAGLAFASATPNRIGEFVGRVWHLPAENRVAGGSNTFIAGLVQLLITVFFGWVAVVWILCAPYTSLPLILNNTLWPLMILLPVLLLFVFLLLMGVPGILDWMSHRKYLTKFSNELQAVGKMNKKVFTEIFFFSALRFFVFLLQYWVAFKLCNVNIHWVDVFVLTSFMFLLLTAVPSIAFLELGLRWEMGIFLFRGMTENLFGISLAMFLIWLINLTLPALAGSLLFLKRSKR